MILRRGTDRSPRTAREGRPRLRSRRALSERGLFLALILVLNVVGTVMVLSASSVESMFRYGSPWSVFERQVLWVVLGLAAFAFVARVDYRKWQRWSVPLLVVTVLLLLVVLMPGIGVHAAGSSRWIGAGPVKMQPSELAKLALVLFGADLLARRGDQIGEWKVVGRPFVIVLGVLALLILKQPDMGTTMVIVAIAIGMLFLANMPGRHLALLSAVLVSGALVVGLAEPYRRQRLTSFLHPFSHRSDAGYQVVQSLSALGSGHVMGIGLGAGRAKWGFLPNAYTDFIFSVIGEELGLIGALVVVCLFAVLAILGIRVARRAPDRFGCLLAGGATCWMIVQAVINMGTVLGVMPVTGIPLPFISYGGSSLLIIMVAMGMVMNVAAAGIPDTAAASAPGRRRALDVPKRATRHVRPSHVGRYSRRASLQARHPAARGR